MLLQILFNALLYLKTTKFAQQKAFVRNTCSHS